MKKIHWKTFTWFSISWVSGEHHYSDSISGASLKKKFE